jgi:thiamine-monophosphate kinase
MIDITDGLSSDLNRICVKSRVGAVIEAVKIPISDDAGKTDDPLASALNDGEDFELLFAISPENYNKLIDGWTMATAITQIGTVSSFGKMQIISPDGETTDLLPKGYDHL